MTGTRRGRGTVQAVVLGTVGVAVALLALPRLWLWLLDLGLGGLGAAGIVWPPGIWHLALFATGAVLVLVVAVVAIRPFASGARLASVGAVVATVLAMGCSCVLIWFGLSLGGRLTTDESTAVVAGTVVLDADQPLRTESLDVVVSPGDLRPVSAEVQLEWEVYPLAGAGPEPGGSPEVRLSVRERGGASAQVRPNARGFLDLAVPLDGCTPRVPCQRRYDLDIEHVAGTDAIVVWSAKHVVVLPPEGADVEATEGVAGLGPRPASGAGTVWAHADLGGLDGFSDYGERPLATGESVELTITATVDARGLPVDVPAGGSLSVMTTTSQPDGAPETALHTTIGPVDQPERGPSTDDGRSVWPLPGCRGGQVCTERVRYRAACATTCPAGFDFILRSVELHVVWPDTGPAEPVTTVTAQLS